MLYEFACPSCGRAWEERRRLAQIEEPAHCKCGQLGERRISASAVIFKCAGFPSNDSKGSWGRRDGRTMSFGEREFLDREAADDAAAKPDTCVNVAKRGDTKIMLGA